MYYQLYWLFSLNAHAIYQKLSGLTNRGRTISFVSTNWFSGVATVLERKLPLTKTEKGL